MRGGSAAPNYDASIRLQDDWRNEWRKGAGGWNTVGGVYTPLFCRWGVFPPPGTQRDVGEGGGGQIV